MIRGIGVDMVCVSRMRRVYDKNPERLAKKILTSNEYQKYNTVSDQVQFLAKCWAVKEATFKAYGDSRIDMLKDIEYDSPNVKVFGCGGTTHLSLSDDNGYVVAFVVMEIENEH